MHAVEAFIFLLIYSKSISEQRRILYNVVVFLQVLLLKLQQLHK